MAIPPALEECPDAEFHLEGLIGERSRNSISQWLLSAPQANPAILQIFRDRDRLPRRDLVPWAGEFAGKYLTSAVLALRLTPEPRLRACVQQFVSELIATQDTNGYLGPAPREHRLSGKTKSGDYLWDLWGHYHCMLGLWLWFGYSRDTSALEACTKAADLIYSQFLNSGIGWITAGAEEMNMAISHIYCLLYEQTGEERYLSTALSIKAEWQKPQAGDYMRTALSGIEFFRTPKPRWESLHDIQAIAELYFITGDQNYRKAFEHIWWSIVKGDRHNTGGFSSGESATGNPYDPRAIETCCSVAWIALSIDMLRMTGKSVVADEIELSTFNSILGAQHPSGRWWTYNTPMDGVRKGSAHDIVFQAREGSPELNCCSVNGPRGLGMISQWAIMQTTGGLALNYYGPAVISASLPSGNRIVITQTTRYPQDGFVELTLNPTQIESFDLSLRIPAWSEVTRVEINGDEITEILRGSYLSLTREWRGGDKVRLWLDMSPHVWIGEREAAGKVSIYVGPVLLVYDQKYNDFEEQDIPIVTANALDTLHLLSFSSASQALMLAQITCDSSTTLRLCDFASAGFTGTHYRSWLPASPLKLRSINLELPIWCTHFDQD